ncbi:MAG TPA: TetR/AcrR family transcriptional regulator [Bradyrhizobium sp.]|nr:TetR/AcrR family transcriptional regulator [Bradyrhizobium sp.]
MIGRPREFDRETALQAAMLVFWRKGFAATSMNDLCDAMGIRSPSLYAAFGSKEALYLEAMEHYVKTVGPTIWDKLAATSARDGVEKMLLAATEILPETGPMPAGCMAVLGGVGDEWPAAVADVVREVRLEMLGNLQSRLKTAVTEGELPAAADVDRLSRFYLSVFQGMALQARDGATSEELKGVAASAMLAWPGEG